MGLDFFKKMDSSFVETVYIINNLIYMLQGVYNYNDVELLREGIDSTAIYGFSIQKGPVAFLGLPNIDYDISLFYDVWEYGKHRPLERYDFERYTEEDAKKISNYTVYGSSGIEKIRDFVKFEKINLFNDSRYRIKELREPKVASMEIMLDGTYSFSQSIAMVNHKDFKLIGKSVVFAMVDNKYPIGIIGLNLKDIRYIKGFRDVYEYGVNIEKPKVQKIRFLSDRAAQKIDEFELYIYNYVLPEQFERRYNICKKDRSFDSRFDFYNTPSGKDYRLIRYSHLLVKRKKS